MTETGQRGADPILPRAALVPRGIHETAHHAVRESRQMIGAIRLEREEMLDLRYRLIRRAEPRHHLAAAAGCGMGLDRRQEHRVHTASRERR